MTAVTPSQRPDEPPPPTGIEVDAASGVPTTGHSWDGIRELNRPLPRWWVITFYATIVFALGYMVLYPAIPLWRGSTPGVLGYSTRAAVEQDLAATRAQQAELIDRIAVLPLTSIVADPGLLRFATAGGRSAFSVNCVPCHGSGAAGSPGYANLNDDDWLWGGDLDAIYRSIAYGVRSNHPDARTSAMPSFGADGLLTRTEIGAVTEYVRSLSGLDNVASLAATGRTVFDQNCLVCHGITGIGNRDVGAPALNDAIWLYGSDRATLQAQISTPRHGVMPAWAGRLDDTVLKELAVFVYSLGGGETAPR